MNATRIEELEKAWECIGNVLPKNSKILITGANGLIASNLIDLFMYCNKVHNTNNYVMALCRNRNKGEDRFREYLEEKDFIIIGQDVCSLSIDEKCDYIIHAASNAHPVAYSTKPIETIKTNVLGTINVLEFAHLVNVKKVVYVSSSEIYGEGGIRAEKFRENEWGSVNTLSPRTCYSESKRCAENICICFGTEKNLDVSIVRPGYIYGAQITNENSRADAQFLRNVLCNKNIVMKSEGLQKRSYCYVLDAVCAIIFVMMKGDKGEAYNIANRNSEATIREYAETMADIKGVKVVFDIPSISEKSGFSTVKNSLLSDEKLLELGWRPQYDLRQGLTNTILQMREA